uniref:Uncharacterized protein n=1 Tax=Meloidogyne enterolobii TaxID=390850 RepID=A0A6V7XJU0_MELEN|nr:unnamed protein product [Meloidogyne enterolobii]
MVGVYDWLSKQKYSFGIAEFNFIVGPFAVFEALGIENTFNVFATPFFPGYLQYLGIDVTLYNIPDLKPPPSSIEFLFKKIKLHFVNQHYLANSKNSLSQKKLFSLEGFLLSKIKF